MGIQFNMIAARSSNNGIGWKGNLPWSLRKEMKYFLKMTKDVRDPKKKNAVIMGRKTWESLPPHSQPMPDRFNFVLSTQPLNLTGAVLCSSFHDLLEKISSADFEDKIETAWVIGGSKIYEEALNLKLCHRLYLTEILKDYECDTFLNIDVKKGFKEVSDDRVPEGVQEENQVQYIFRVYEKL